MSVMYDPIKVGGNIKSQICKSGKEGEERKYYRFRGGKWYGGIASGDVIGCNLSCKFCWAWYFRDRYDLGAYYSPVSAFKQRRRIAEKRGNRLVRLTGGEPTLCRNHLISLVDIATAHGYFFIVETNGLLLGYDEGYAKEISSYEGVIVRVSFKGTNPQEFNMLTGADPYRYDLQYKALVNLVKNGLQPCKEVIPALMVSFSDDASIAKFIMHLSEIDEQFARCIDWELVIMYPHVKKILEHYHLKPRRYINP